jgi:DNA invertase Pin-like site-specific DNA recombinase
LQAHARGLLSSSNGCPALRPIVATKKRGVKFGRKPKLTPEQVVLAVRMVDEGQPVPQGADAFGVHEATIYRCLSAAEAAA